MLSLMSSEEVCFFIADSIREERLRQGRDTQKSLAAKADIPHTTYKLIEREGKGSIENLVRVLSALGKVEDLSNLIVPPTFSPIEELKQQNRPKRRRVDLKRTKK